MATAMTDRRDRPPLVCFDLGGVLVRICRNWAEGCAAAGIDVRDPSLGQVGLDVKMEVIHRFDIGDLSDDEFCAEISTAFRGVYSPSEVRRVLEAWIIGEYPGAHDLVLALHAANVETACLSNTNALHWAQLDRYPSIFNLRHRHASHLLRLRKPDDAIYSAFERAVARAPHEIIFFDDLPDNVAAAQSRGWRAHHINPAENTPARMSSTLRNLGVLL